MDDHTPFFVSNFDDGKTSKELFFRRSNTVPSTDTILQLESHLHEQENMNQHPLVTYDSVSDIHYFH